MHPVGLQKGNSGASEHAVFAEMAPEHFLEQKEGVSAMIWKHPEIIDRLNKANSYEDRAQRTAKYQGEKSSRPPG